jgi:signal transduction histidine kinase
MLRLTGLSALANLPLGGRAWLVIDDERLGVWIADQYRRGGLHAEWSPPPADPFAPIVRADPDLLVVAVRGRDARLDLVRRLKDDVATHFLPVVVVSADPATRLPALEAGADHWLPEPVSPEELHARTGALLRTRGLSRLVESRQETLRMRRDWVRYLVHDLRGPIGVCSANNDFLTHELSQLTPPRDDLLEAIRDGNCALDRMLRMTQDLMDGDRLQSGTLRLRVLEQPLLPIAEEAAQAVRSRAPEARVRPIVVRGAPEARGRVDGPLFGRVLTNLLFNALRYAPPDCPILVDVEARGTVGRVSVSNHGPPIEEPDRERIFHPFVRLETTSRFGEGAGLGLAFCKLAVESHGGRISVENRDGLVVFRVELPLAEAAHPLPALRT